jgi:tetratricopeptide (TPR) repeat protein
MTLPPSSLHNQYRLDDDDFVANFVARHDVLDALLRRLGATGKKDTGLHHMLIGTRGMGKTSLLRRVAIAVNRDEALAARYVPLSFREEQYNVLSLADFWRNCGEALAEWADSNDRADLAERLDRAIDRGEWSEGETAAERFAEEMKALGRRAILLVDNLDLILTALDPEDHWVLRRHLQAPDGPVMIGAATQALKESADREAAFYEFLQPHHLDPLDEQETESCMRALAQRRGEPGQPVVEVLDRQPERLRTLHNLTGGNPRVLALIYRLLESAETDAAMADLEILLDQVTPYYKARIEEYQTPPQRAVIDAIALHWDPITVGTLSNATNIVANTLSGMLQKLRKDGLIEQVEGSGAYARHQIVERFLNIWYLMRHGTRRTRQKMRWLVEYLASFYAPDELAELARRYRGSWCGDYAVAADEALARSEIGARELAVFPRAKVNGDKLARVANDLNVEAIRQLEAGDTIRCLAIVDQVIARFGGASDPTLREQIAVAIGNKGVALGRGGNSAGAIASYDELIARFGEATELALRKHVATAMLNKGIMLGERGDEAEEIALYDALIARFEEPIELALREDVAIAMNNKAITLGQSGDSAGAIAAYEELIARFGEAPQPPLREQVAKALFNKGAAHRDSGDSAGAITTCEELIARFGEATEPAVREQVAKALFNKGATLGDSGDIGAAITAYEELIARFGEASEPILRENVAGALFMKGVILDAMGEWDVGIREAERSVAILNTLEGERASSLRSIAKRGLADRFIDRREDYARAAPLLAEAAETFAESAQLSLAWLNLLDGRSADAARIRLGLGDARSPQLALLDAGLALGSEDFGVARGDLAAALGNDPPAAASEHARDLERLLRLAERRGHGERLIAWFEESSFADRLAPVYAAFVAYVRGERALLDVNPEVRRPARIIYDRLDAPRQCGRAKEPAIAPAKRGRGRPRKAGGGSAGSRSGTRR